MTHCLCPWIRECCWMRSGHVRTKTGDNIVFSSRNAVVRKQGAAIVRKRHCITWAPRRKKKRGQPRETRRRRDEYHGPVIAVAKNRDKWRQLIIGPIPHLGERNSLETQEQLVRVGRSKSGKKWWRDKSLQERHFPCS